MKLKRVVSLCTDAKCLVLFDKTDKTGEINQWASDRMACYRLDGIPYLDGRTVFNTLDIPENKRAKMYFNVEQMPESINVGDDEDDEVFLESIGIEFVYGGVMVKPLRTPDGIIYIQSKYLAPFSGDMEFMRLYQRKTSHGGDYIVVKIGMLAAAIIFPYDLVKGDGFTSMLGEILDLTERERKRRKGEKEQEGGAQTDLFGRQEPEEGEGEEDPAEGEEPGEDEA